MLSVLRPERGMMSASGVPLIAPEELKPSWRNRILPSPSNKATAAAGLMELGFGL